MWNFLISCNKQQIPRLVTNITFHLLTDGLTIRQKPPNFNSLILIMIGEKPSCRMCYCLLYRYIVWATNVHFTNLYVLPSFLLNGIFFSLGFSCRIMKKVNKQTSIWKLRKKHYLSWWVVYYIPFEHYIYIFFIVCKT